MKPVSQIKFRCSSLGHVLSGAGGITAKQLATIRELETREKALTPKMKEELAYLIEKRDNKQLPAGVKTHLIDLYTSIYENRTEDAEGPQIEKGNVREKDALILVGMHLKRKLTKNTERREDDFIQGEMDAMFERTTVDTKCNFTRLTFNRMRFLKEIDYGYEQQGRGYMRLWNAEKHIVAHCCLNGLASHIQSQIDRLRFYYEPGTAKWKAKAKQIEINHIFNLSEFMAENPGYEMINDPNDWSFDIPWQDRVYMWSFNRDQNWDRKMVTRVTECRQWMNENLLTNQTR